VVAEFRPIGAASFKEGSRIGQALQHGLALCRLRAPLPALASSGSWGEQVVKQESHIQTRVWGSGGDCLVRRISISAISELADGGARRHCNEE